LNWSGKNSDFLDLTWSSFCVIMYDNRQLSMVMKCSQSSWIERNVWKPTSAFFHFTSLKKKRDKNKILITWTWSKLCWCRILDVFVTEWNFGTIYWPNWKLYWYLGVKYFLDSVNCLLNDGQISFTVLKKCHLTKLLVLKIHHILKNLTI